MNGTLQGLSIILHHLCCKYLEEQRVIYDPRGRNRRWKVQEQEIILLVSLMIPPMNKREIRVNTPSLCSVNADMQLELLRSSSFLFISIRQDATDWSD